jgi:hypothetical protein
MAEYSHKFLYYTVEVIHMFRIGTNHNDDGIAQTANNLVVISYSIS